MNYVAVPGSIENLRFSDVYFNSVNVEWDEPAEPNGIITSECEPLAFPYAYLC